MSKKAYFSAENPSAYKHVNSQDVTSFSSTSNVQEWHMFVLGALKVIFGKKGFGNEWIIRWSVHFSAYPTYLMLRNRITKGSNYFEIRKLCHERLNVTSKSHFWTWKGSKNVTGGIKNVACLLFKKHEKYAFKGPIYFEVSTKNEGFLKCPRSLS